MIVASKNLRTKFPLTFFFFWGGQFSISDKTHDRGRGNFPSRRKLTTGWVVSHMKHKTGGRGAVGGTFVSQMKLTTGGGAGNFASRTRQGQNL